MFDLVSNWGTESDPAVKYHDGNSEPKGFGECLRDIIKCINNFLKSGDS